jgi:hypothetical protein
MESAVFSAGKRLAKKGNCLGQFTLQVRGPDGTEIARRASNHQQQGFAKRKRCDAIN